MNHLLEAVILAWVTLVVLVLYQVADDVPKWAVRLSNWIIAPWFVATCTFTGWVIAT